MACEKVTNNVFSCAVYGAWPVVSKLKDRSEESFWLLWTASLIKGTEVCSFYFIEFRLFIIIIFIIIIITIIIIFINNIIIIVIIIIIILGVNPNPPVWNCSSIILFL